MIGASQHIEIKNPIVKKIFCHILFFAVACTVSSCTLFRAGIEQQSLSPEDWAFYSTYSKKFGIRFAGTENKKLISGIDEWLGVPHRLGGCSKSGIDCSCFVRMIYLGVYGITLRRSSCDMFSDVLMVAAKDIREGDLLFFKGQGKKIFHVGIYLKQGKFAHVTSARGVVISSLQEDYYRKYFYAGGRVAKNG